MNLKNIDFKKINLFKPAYFLIFYLIFILLTISSFFTNLPMEKPGILSFLVIFSSFPFFIAGTKAGKFLHNKKIPKALIFAFSFLAVVFYALVFSNFYNANFYFSLAISAAVLLFLYILFYKNKRDFEISYKYLGVLIFIGILFFICTLLKINGIPLFNPALKLKVLANTTFGLAMVFFFPGYIFLIQKIKDKKMFFAVLMLSTILFSLMAYRGPVLVIFFAGVITAYCKKFLDAKKIFSMLAAAFFIIIFIGYIAMPILSPLKLLLYRAGTTHIVFDKIVQDSFPLGLTHGTLFFNGDPRFFVGEEIMGYKANLTYTILGQPMLDFGLPGVFLFMFLLGLVLKLAYESRNSGGIFRSFYPLLFSISLIWIEIGVDQFYLMFFAVFLLLYMFKNS